METPASFCKAVFLERRPKTQMYFPIFYKFLLCFSDVISQSDPDESGVIMESTLNISQPETTEIDAPVITSTPKNGKEIEVVSIKSESEHDTGNLINI